MSRLRLSAFENRRDALAAANAHGLQPVAAAAALQFIQHRRKNAHAGCRDRVAERKPEIVNSLMRPLLATRSLALETQVEEGLPKVLGDRERLLQVLSNLIGNALKFSDRGTVSLLAWQEAGEVRACVADQGKGIAPDELPRVFERYFQGPHGPTALGAGLGLSIARGIVEAHGGRIWVESREGQGSRFRVELPLAG